MLPHWNISTLALLVSLLGVINSLTHAWIMLRPWPSWQKALCRVWLTVVSLYLYGYELVCALRLIISPTHTSLVFSLGILLMGIYGLALLRAWELLGVQRTGLLGWLNPLYSGYPGRERVSFLVVVSSPQGVFEFPERYQTECHTGEEQMRPIR